MKFKIGHTGITWGYSTEMMEQAVRDVSELGYRAFETFGKVLADYQGRPGGFKTVLERYDIPLSAIYCPTAFYDPADAQADIEQVEAWARLAAQVGVDTVVLQAGRRGAGPYPYFPGMGEVFNEIGRRVKALHLVAGIHPHTGTLIETPEEIDAILAAVDPDLVGFAPDTGQIDKGGGSAIATLERHKEIIRHVHLKDYGGGGETGYAGYEPIGSGVIDMGALFDILESVDFHGWVMVELDDTPQRPRPPREAALMSRRYLGKLLGDRAEWRHPIHSGGKDMSELKVLLLVGGPVYHDTPGDQREALGFLDPHFSVTMTDDMTVLTPENLAKYDVIANYTTFFEPTEGQIKALLDAVAGGKGFVGIHGATATFWNSPEYLEMIGGKFIEHDKNKIFHVKMNYNHTESSPITEGIEDFDIQDELYIIEGDLTQWHILARAEGHPIVYTKMWGQGRVYSNAMGHDSHAIGNPGFQELIVRGVKWAAGGL